jgi:hypothetical protein
MADQLSLRLRRRGAWLGSLLTGEGGEETGRRELVLLLLAAVLF